jgi:HD-GYP domain-containing protein (c-di-GMP phosphodiesterase class II)
MRGYMDMIMDQNNSQAAQTASSLDTRRFQERRGVLSAGWISLHPHQVIRAFLSQMKIIDPALLEHTRSVTHYTLLMARNLNLPQRDRRELLYSTLLHDLGKIGIDKRIMEKREKLTPQEWEIIRAHPINSVKILSSFPCFVDICPIIRHHHERFDGTGYPDGLKGEQIPFMSRLITVVDAFVAMTNVRTYQASLTISDALETIEENKGKQFDPKLTTPFVAVVLETLKRRAVRGQTVQKVNADML